ncbi:hypothetical protein BJ944DRAFT_160861 [Cunninghamella echinulata]|nr:hypothetical protein BJ944DRAFT_160861 [Cunninghamella echinulata]
MALDITRATSDIIQRRVCQYFTDTLMAVSGGGEEDMDELKRVHEMIEEIYFIAPSLLLNVIPQLEEEMTLDELGIRQLAIETLGNMFAHKSSTLYKQYPNIWKGWLGREVDKSAVIRTRWLELCGTIYLNHAENVANDINACLNIKLMDPEEKVRIVACKIVGQLNFDIVTKYLDDNILKGLGSRCKDKKKLWKRWLESMIWYILICKYQYYYIIISFNSIALENTIQQYIIPENTDDNERTERLVTVLKSLNHQATCAFLALLRREHAQDKIETLLRNISNHFGERARPRIISCLRQMKEMDNIEVIRNLRACINVENEYKRILKARQTLLRHVELESPGSMEVCSWILNRINLLTINKSNVPYLYSMLRSTRGHRQSVAQSKSDAAQRLLKEMASCYPKMFILYNEEVIRNLTNESDDSLVNFGLELLATITKALPAEIEIKSKTIAKLSSLIAQGNRTESEHSAVILSNVDNSDIICTEVIEDLYNEINLGNVNLVSPLTSLCEFAYYVPLLLQQHIEKLCDFIEFQCLAQIVHVDDDENSEWDDYENLTNITKQKLAAVPILSNYLRGMAKIKETVEKELVDRIVTLLWKLIDITCEEAISNNISGPESSHLRIIAAQGIVQIAEYEPYQDTMNIKNFEQLGLLLQDTCYYVRYEFGTFLMSGLKSNELHPRYYVLLFLCAHEPEEAFLKTVQNFIRRRASFIESVMTSRDMSFIRLIHLLAHHPDFTTEDEDLITFAHFIEFYLSCIATSENISYLYHASQKIKTSVDIVSEEKSINSHVLADIACLLILRKAKKSSWNVDVWTQPIKLQSKLYRILPPGPIQQEALKKNYLSEKFINYINRDQRSDKV